MAVVGAGPIGLSASMGSRLFSASQVVAIDKADSRLEAAKEFGADVTLNNADEDAIAAVRSMTDGLARLVTFGRPIDAGSFVTHRFAIGQFMEAYDVFARASDTRALKVVLTRNR